MTTRSYLFGDVVTVIDGATAAGTTLVPGGDVVSVPSEPIGNRPPSGAFMVVVAGGVPSALTVEFLYSLDGTNWFIDSAVTDVGGGFYPQTGIIAPFVAADIATLTVSSGTPAVTVKWTSWNGF
jgi:hypothetical protein